MFIRRVEREGGLLLRLLVTAEDLGHVVGVDAVEVQAQLARAANSSCGAATPSPVPSS